MRRWALIAIAIACLGCQGWTRADTYRQAAATALLAADWMQTREIAAQPERFHERNPILGSHPAPGEVDAYFAASAAASWAVAAVLPRGFWREAFQYGLIGIELGVVAHNQLIGIRVGF